MTTRIKKEDVDDILDVSRSSAPTTSHEGVASTLISQNEHDDIVCREVHTTRDLPSTGSESQSSNTDSVSSALPVLNGGASGSSSIATHHLTLSAPPPTSLPQIPPEGCQCPINLECPFRGSDKIDCGILVPKKKQWQDARNSLPNPWNIIPDRDMIEVFATAEHIRDGIVSLDHLANHPASGFTLNRIFTALEVWLGQMQRMSVREDEFHQLDAIEHLNTFLLDENASYRRKKRVPVSLYEDLTILFRKWSRGDFGVHPYRGCTYNKGGSRIKNPNWPHVMDGRFFGEEHLVNGQIFAGKWQMSVEGAHADIRGGISGGPKQGAYSIVMGLYDPKKDNSYADVDCGDEIYYIGTELKNTNDYRPTNDMDREDEEEYKNPGEAPLKTRTLMKSYETQKPVRLFRSGNAAPIVKRRPAKDYYRYDGLYRVKNWETLKMNKQICRFYMVRIPGQNPLRGMPVEEPKLKNKRKPGGSSEDDDDDGQGPSSKRARSLHGKGKGRAR